MSWKRIRHSSVLKVCRSELSNLASGWEGLEELGDPRRAWLRVPRSYRVVRASPLLCPKAPKPQSPKPKAQSPKPKAQSPKPKAQSPEPQSPRAPEPQSPEPGAQGPRSKVQGPRSKVQGPRSKPQTPNPKPQTPNPKPQGHGEHRPAQKARAIIARLRMRVVRRPESFRAASGSASSVLSVCAMLAARF